MLTEIYVQLVCKIRKLLIVFKTLALLIAMTSETIVLIKKKRSITRPFQLLERTRELIEKHYAIIKCKKSDTLKKVD